METIKIVMAPEGAPPTCTRSRAGKPEITLQDQFAADRLIEAYDPFLVLSELAKPIIKMHQKWHVASPVNPAYLLEVTQQGLLGTETDCEFGAGTILDYLASDFGGDYCRAIDFCLHFLRRIGRCDAEPISREAPTLARTLHENRRQFLAVRGLRKNWVECAEDASEASAVLKKRHVNSESIRKIMSVARGAVINRFLPESNYLPESVLYFVLPYFSNYFTVSALELITVSGDAPSQTVWLDHASHAYLSLGNIPRGGVTYFYPSSWDLVYAHNDAGAKIAVQRGVHAIFNSKGRRPGMILPCGVVAYTDQEAGLLSRYRQICHEFFVQRHTGSDQLCSRLPWERFVLEEFAARIHQDQRVSPRLRLFLQNIRTDRKAALGIVSALRFHKAAPEITEEVWRTIHPHLSLSIRNVAIAATREGYTACLPHSPSPVEIANFTVHIDERVQFDDTDDLFYSGRIHFSGWDYPLFILSDHTRNARKMERAARLAVTRDSHQGHLGFPSVFNPRLWRTYISEVLRTQEAGCPMVRGVRTLGWNRQRSVFITPTWQASSEGVTPTSLIAHPETPILSSCFSFKNYQFLLRKI